MIGELTTTRPAPNYERAANWYAKASRSGYPMLTGPLWERRGQEYARDAMRDNEAAQPDYAL